MIYNLKIYTEIHIRENLIFFFSSQIILLCRVLECLTFSWFGRISLFSDNYFTLLDFLFFAISWRLKQSVSKHKCQTLDTKQLLKFRAWWTVYKLCVGDRDREPPDQGSSSWTRELWLQGRDSSSVNRVKSNWRQHQCPPLASINIYTCTLTNIWSHTCEHTPWAYTHKPKKETCRE